MFGHWWRARWGFLILLFSGLFLNSLRAYTHWVMTEDGRIVAQDDSVFHLKRPHDFVALMGQEERMETISQLEKEIFEEKGVKKIGGHQVNVEDEDVESKVFSTDPDCRETGSLFSEMDLYPSLVPYLWPLPKEADQGAALRGVRSLFEGRQTEIKKLVPVCSSPRIMHVTTFDHLKSVQANLDSEPLKMGADHDLSRLLGWEYVPRINGSLAAARIKLDASDWDAYNWASVYWRVVGNASEALECARRSVHHSPREYKDIGLHLMGMVLHLSRSSHDAMVVLEAALDHVLPLVKAQPDSEELRRRTQVSALSVGVVAAMVEDYNRSAEAFEIALEYGDTGAAKIKSPIKEYPHAIRCYQKMEKALKEQKDVLQKTLEELKQQQVRYTRLLEQREKALQERATPDMIIDSRLSYEHHRIQRSKDGRGHDCFQYQQQGQIFLSCNVRRRRDAPLNADDLDALLSFDELLNPSSLRHRLEDLEYLQEKVNQNLAKQEESAKKLHSAKELDAVFFAADPEKGVNDSDDSEFIKINYSEVDKEALAATRVKKTVVNINGPGGPEPDDCLPFKGQLLPQAHEYPTVFSTGREKGIDLKGIFDEAVRIAPEAERSMAAISPQCEGFSDNQMPPFARLQAVQEIGRLTQIDDDSPALREAMAEAVGPALSMHEIGQKIRRTMSIIQYQQKELPSWPVFNLAGLYWRLEGKPNEAIVCFLRAYLMAEADDAKEGTADVDPPRRPLVQGARVVPSLNLAGAVYKMGFLEDAVDILKKAFAIDSKHTPTNIMLGNMLLAAEDYDFAFSHLMQAVMVNPLDDDAWHAFIANYCRFVRSHEVYLQQHCAGDREDNESCTTSSGVKPSIHISRLTPDAVEALRPDSDICVVADGKDENPRCDLQDEASVLEAPCHLAENERTGDSIVCAMARTDEEGGMCPLEKRDDCDVGIHCFVAAKDERGRWSFDVDVSEVTRLFAALPNLEECSVDPNYSKKTLEELKAAYAAWSRSVDPKKRQTGSKKETGDQNQVKVKVNINGKKTPVVAEDINAFDAPEVITVTTVVDDPLPDLLLSPVLMAKQRNRFKSRSAYSERSWPTPTLEECANSPELRLDNPKSVLRAPSYISTWLAANADDVKWSDHILPASAVSKDSPREPICDPNFPPSILTLDHLSGVRYREYLTQSPEVSLRKALLELGTEREDGRESASGDENGSDDDQAPLVHAMGKRIAASLAKTPHSWVVSSVAALYWRVVGDASRAVDCLRISLHYAPWQSRDKPLISLANIFHRSLLLNDSLIVANMAMDVSPSIVLIHFAMANVYSHMMEFDLAADFYRSTLALQSTVQPAKERLKAIQCVKLKTQASLEAYRLLAPDG